MFFFPFAIMLLLFLISIKITTSCSVEMHARVTWRDERLIIVFRDLPLISLKSSHWIVVVQNSGRKEWCCHHLSPPAMLDCNSVSFRELKLEPKLSRQQQITLVILSLWPTYSVQVKLQFENYTIIAPSVKKKVFVSPLNNTFSFIDAVMIQFSLPLGK